MSVSNDYQVKQTQIGRQIALIVRDENVDTGNHLIDEQRNIHRPLLIVVASHDIQRRNRGKGVQDSRIIDVAAVKDGVGSGERISNTSWRSRP